MKSKILLPIALLISLNVFAQEAVISGKVFEKESREPLYGASVIVEGDYGGVATDDTGGFVLRTNSKGAKQLRISFIGFGSETIPVNLESGTVDVGEVYLSSELASLDAFEVRASLEGQQRALNQQRTSDNIK